MNNYQKYRVLALVICFSMGGLASAAPNDDQYKNFDKAQRLKTLTPLQYNVTQKGATEKSFDNPYWHNKIPGIYVDIVSGEPLFSSTINLILALDGQVLLNRLMIIMSFLSRNTI